jgi:predicted helicase
MRNVRETQIKYADLWGLRKEKYKWLGSHDVQNTKWQRLSPSDPYYFFVPKSEEGWDLYQNFWRVTDIFPVNSVGVVTSRDNFVIDFDKNTLESRVRTFVNTDDKLAEAAFGLRNKKNWTIREAQQKLKETQNWPDYIVEVLYRPFDKRWIIYHPAAIERDRREVMQHMLRPNLALLAKRQAKFDFSYAFVTDKIAESCVFESAYANNMVFPLYLYGDTDKTQTLLDSQEKLDLEGTQHTLRTKNERSPNIADGVLKLLNKTFSQTPSVEEIFCYIYAVLYSDTYRQKYQEFLKIDFPRVPFTKNYKLFQKLAKLGEELVDLHLLKSKELEKPIVKFQGKNDNLVKKREYKNGRVYINESQYFEGIAPKVWNYHIGGYQVLDKWLKDRKGRVLSSEDIKHYCRVATALQRTIGLQNQIDKLYPRVEEALISSG